MNWEMTLQNTFLDFVNFTITGGWIILAVLILRAMLGRVPRKYMCVLWFVVLFRLLCPVTIETELSVVPQPTTITYQEIAYTTPKIETNLSVINTVADYTVNPVMEEYFAPNPQGSVNPMQVYLFIASTIWVLGIVVLASYTIISWVRMCLRLRESIPEAGYYRCGNIDTPFVFGLLKPKIYLPYGLEGETKTYVLLHEQSHIARKDFWVKPLFWLAVTIHWMNPLVWVAWHYFSRDLELACDECAIDKLSQNQKAAYSNTLLNLAIQPKVLHCPVAFGNNSVKQRITHVLHYNGIPTLVRDIILILLVLVMVLLAVNPLKAGTLSEFEPKLLKEYPYGLNSVNIRYGLIDISINDSDISAIHSEQAAAFRDWLANVKVQSVKEANLSSGYDAGVYIGVSGITNYEYDESDMIRSYEFDVCNFEISNDLSLIYRDERLRIRNPEKFREVILSYCLEELLRYRDMAFYADLNHDGMDEMIIVDPGQTWDAQGQAEIAVYKQDGTLLFWDYLNYAHPGWDNYFLYEKDGNDYLLEFMPSMYQGVANYSWKLYEFDKNNNLVIAEENMVEFSINLEQYDFEIPRIYAFLTEMETMLNDATLLVSVENFELEYSRVNESKTLSIEYYLDWLNPVWKGEKNMDTLKDALSSYQTAVILMNRYRG